MIEVSLVPVDRILSFRDLYQKEMGCQIVLDSWHARGWTDSYLLQLNGRVVGYGSVGDVRAECKDIVTEFYVLPPHRASSLELFRRFIEASRATRFEVQTNDIPLTLLIYDCAARIESPVILFADALTTHLTRDGVNFRMDEVRQEWVLEVETELVAWGGILFHYNVPFGDIYMEVAEPWRRRGYGSYLIQELKRTCYEMGRIPAARCKSSNVASRGCLQRAGMLPCARVLTGDF